MKVLVGYEKFLDLALETIKISGIDVSRYWLDHIAWQCETEEEYDTMKLEFLKFSEEVSEEIVGERRVGVFKPNEPLTYKETTLIAIELVAPKPGKFKPQGWQHVEFVIATPFRELMNKYPAVNWNTDSIDRAEFSHLVIDFPNGVTVKFHHSDIITAIKRNRGT